MAIAGGSGSSLLSTGALEWPAHASHRCAEEVAEEVMEGADLRSGPAGPSRAWGLVPRAALSLPLIYVVSSPFMLSQPHGPRPAPCGCGGRRGSAPAGGGGGRVQASPWVAVSRAVRGCTPVCLWSSVSGSCFEGLGKCRPSSALAATCKG